MRTLCLNFQKNEKPSLAEVFLQFSPQLQYRKPGLLFLDISSTAHLFGGESQLLREVLQLSQSLHLPLSAAIADQPSTAQGLSLYQPSSMSRPNEDSSALGPLPLAALNHLEGLICWQPEDQIEQIISFFKLVGLNQISDIQQISRDSLRQQWGKTGERLWQKIHGREQQALSPYIPKEALIEFIHLDFSVSLMSFLLHCIEKQLQRLLARLQGRGEFAQRIRLHLHCEFSGQIHLLEIQPLQACRDLDILMKLIEHKLESIELDNPIQHIEIEALPVPERIEQLDFWQPRVKDQDKVHALSGLLRQAEVHSGFFQLKDEILPEKSWQLNFEFMDYEPIEDQVHVDGKSFQIKPAHSSSLRSAPRPSLLFSSPQRISGKELRKLEFLSSYPVERLEESWWESTRGRDYYVALSPKGECLWVYHDRVEDQYYLHGYY